MLSFNTIAAVLGALLLSQQPCLALPTEYAGSHTDVSPNYEYGLHRRAESQDFFLRILPLGASIINGKLGVDDEKNGFRKLIREELRSQGWKVNMVGNIQSGSMNDNDHEGVDGDHISEVHARAKDAVKDWLPNLVLLNAGTNDAWEPLDDEPVKAAGKRMKSLIENIFTDSPKAVVILSTLMPYGEFVDDIEDINKQYRDVARDLSKLEGDDEPGFKVIIADMADGFIESEDMQDDEKHPNTEGYRKMAAVWSWAIGEANEKGYLEKPSDSDDSCRKESGSGNTDSRGERKLLRASNDVIKDDGEYVHDQEETEKFMGWDLIGVKDLPDGVPGLDFANIAGGPHDEVIFVDGNDDERQLMWFSNNEDGSWGDVQKLGVSDGCKVEGIHFRDVDADGLADFICIGKEGDMYVAKNKGGDNPEFGDVKKYREKTDGILQKHVRLGDIDGDGRVDYCGIEDEGDIRCWRNTPDEWVSFGDDVVFTAKGMGNIAGVRFVDINGDGRDDWTWTSKKGEVTTWINERGDDKGMIPNWREAGVTHEGFEEDEYMTWAFLSDNGGADFLRVTTHKDDDCGDREWPYESRSKSCKRYNWKVYLNKGHGGTYKKGDGIRFGDITGTGVDDYVWVSKEGVVQVFPNKNTKDKSDDYETPAWGDPVELETSLDHRTIHVGDWDADGRDDIIGITDPTTGSLKVWYNRGKGSEITFQEEEIQGSNGKCGLGWGSRFRDRAAHFADLTGSGGVDYICMQEDGTATAWVHDEDGNLSDVGQIKSGEGWDRADYRFADADGDGKADLIWVDPMSGDGIARYNKGMKEEEDRDRLHGSIFEWEEDETIYQGSTQGANIYYANLGGEGRADMVGSKPDGTASVWFNSCSGSGEDSGGSDDDSAAQDDGKVEDPKLPEYTPKD